MAQDGPAEFDRQCWRLVRGRSRHPGYLVPRDGDEEGKLQLYQFLVVACQQEMRNVVRA